MKIKDTKLFFNSLSNEEKTKILDSYLEALRNAEKFMLITTKWLAILVFVYYLLSNKLLEGFEFAGAKFSKFEFVEKFFPFGVSCIILFYIIAAIHKAKCAKNYEILFEELYQKSKNSVSILYHARLLMPFGFFKELQNTDNSGCLKQFVSWLSFFPVLIIQILPHIFMYYSLKNIYQFYWCDPYMKLVFFSSIWFVLFGLIKFVAFIIDGVNESLNV